MAFTVAASITGLTDAGLQAAYSAGFASAAAPLARYARAFGWDRGAYDQGLFKPPSSYASIAEGLKVSTEKVEQVGTSSVTVAERALGYKMGMTSYRTTPRDIVMANFAYLGSLWVRLLESMIADKWNNAEGTTTTIDGQPWGSASHTSDAGNQDNLINSNLSFANYSTALTMLGDQLDHRGTKQGGTVSSLVYSTADRVLALQILGALFDAADDRTAVHVDSGSANAVMSMDLNDNNWAVVDELQFNALGALPIPIVRGPAPKETIEEEDTYAYKVTDRVSLAVGNPVHHNGVIIGQGT